MTRGNLLSPFTRTVLLIGYTLFTLLPVAWLFFSTIQTQASLLTIPTPLLPREVTLTNYVDIFKPAAFGENSGQSTFVLSLRNSVVDYDVSINSEQGGNIHRTQASQLPLLEALAAFVNYAIPLPQNPNLAADGALSDGQTAHLPINDIARPADICRSSCS